MEECRCGKCKKLLFNENIINGIIEIRCNRCKKINTLKKGVPNEHQGTQVLSDG